MQATDSIRRNGYVVALVLGLVAMFVLMLGNGWTATLIGLVAAGVVAVVERVAETQRRDRRRST
jgi:uncharacterized membrane protein YjjP (DUF1212 family)